MSGNLDYIHPRVFYYNRIKILAEIRVIFRNHNLFIKVDSGGPVVIVLATGSGVRGFKSGRGRWMFQSVKILSKTAFGRVVKQWSRVVDVRHAKEPQIEIRAS